MSDKLGEMQPADYSVTYGTTTEGGVPPYADDEGTLKRVQEAARKGRTTQGRGVLIDPGKPRFSEQETPTEKEKPSHGELRFSDLDPQVQRTIGDMTLDQRRRRYGTTDLAGIQRAIMGRHDNKPFSTLDTRVRLEIAQMSLNELTHRFGTTDRAEIEAMLLHRLDVDYEKGLRIGRPRGRVNLRWGHHEAEVREENPLVRPRQENPHEVEIPHPFIARLEAILHDHPQAETLIHRIRSGHRVPESRISNLELVVAQLKKAREEAEAAQATKSSEVKAVSADRPENKIPHPTAVVNAKPLENKQGFVARLRSLLGVSLSNPFRGSLPDSE